RPPHKAAAATMITTRFMMGLARLSLDARTAICGRAVAARARDGRAALARADADAAAGAGSGTRADARADTRARGVGGGADAGADAGAAADTAAGSHAGRLRLCGGCSQNERGRQGDGPGHIDPPLRMRRINR